MIEPFTSTRKILLLALGIINLVVYHGLITHDSYNILSSRNEPFYYICKILTHSRDRHGGVVHAEPERTSCVYCAVPGCGDHASTELGQGPSRGVVSPYAPQSPTLVSNLHHIPTPQHGAAVDWLVHAHVLGTRGTERCGVTGGGGGGEYSTLERLTPTKHGRLRRGVRNNCALGRPPPLPTTTAGSWQDSVCHDCAVDPW